MSKARKLLDSMGYSNVILISGDGTLGWKNFAPFDRIVVTAGAPDVPPALIEQLAEGGRMVIPVGNTYLQNLRIIRKEGEDIISEDHCGCTFVPLIGKQGWEHD